MFQLKKNDLFIHLMFRNMWMSGIKEKYVGQIFHFHCGPTKF